MRWRGGISPTAAELAQGTIANWRRLGKYEERMPGDIAAYRSIGLSSTGHTAIVVPGIMVRWGFCGKKAWKIINDSMFKK